MAALADALDRHLPPGAKVLLVGTTPDAAPLAQRFRTVAEPGPGVGRRTDGPFHGVGSDRALDVLDEGPLAAALTQQAGLLDDGGIVAHVFSLGAGTAERDGTTVYRRSKVELMRIVGRRFTTLELLTEPDPAGGSLLLIVARKM